MGGIKQGIGYLTVPIEDHLLLLVKTAMEAHGAMMLPACDTPDGWWVILLPIGTLKVHDDSQAKRRFTIVFPDGFTLLYDELIRHQNRELTLPAISLDIATRSSQSSGGSGGQSHEPATRRLHATREEDKRNVTRR